MNLIFHLLFYILLISLNFTPTISGPEPKIISLNGHLIFEAAEHKNISFKTIGSGCVNLNGIDLTSAPKITGQVINSLEHYRNNFEGSVNKIDKLQHVIEGTDGVLHRLHLIESNSKLNFDNTSNSGQYLQRIRRLNRKIILLQRRVINLSDLLDRDECISDPCRNGGSCRDLFNSFMCHCPSGWEGQTCESDVNECGRFAGTELGCQNGATCINKQGTYECLCNRGWYGLHCTRRTTDCNSGTELCGHGTCISQHTEIGYKCICDQGWTTDSSNLACTVDVNECTMSKPPCSTNPLVTCINVPGSFYCGHCPAGYTGNGYYCTDIDECTISNGGCSLAPMVTCINTPGSRFCGQCPPGYSGNGITCSYQGLCGINNGGCNLLATCRENSRISSTYVECICPLGYIGNGLGLNGCRRSREDATDPCLSQPCIHGTCSTNTTTGDYFCQCRLLYSGRNCDQWRNACDSEPCLNGGTCKQVFSFFRCICPAAYTGLRCQTEQQACGGHLTTESGTLKYPLINSQTYDHRVSCVWIIETNQSKILNISFTRFNVEQSTNCQFDWLKIHDGRDTSAQVLGQFCGTKLPNNGSILSTHNVIYLWFRSDHTIAKSGFELNWTTVDPVCGFSKIVTSHGTIRSPGSPGNYPLDRDCYWYLLAPMNKRFLFHFFTLMIGNNSNCDGDYLEFTSGYSSNSPFAKFCNTSRPAPLYSKGPELIVHFHSNSEDTYPGFQITYSVVESMPGCGGVYTNDQGEIRSPSLNGVYPTDITCEYKIVLSENNRIKITFLSFKLEDSELCEFDYVKIYTGSTTDSPLAERYCGENLPPPYTSLSNELLIVFNTDWETSHEGFHLKYSLVCGGQYTSSSGIIESPGYPNEYGDERYCIYEISQPIGTNIILDMIDFEIEENGYVDCTYDSLEIRDGDNENSTLIGKYCDKGPPRIISTHNYLWIKFESDSTISHRGFRANYTRNELGCGGILKTSMGTVFSPSYPEVYAPLTKCKWIISAPPGNVIQIMWINFKLEQSLNCGYDYVSIFDNNTENGMGGLMGKYCGHKIPPMLLSSSNIVTVIFITDISLNHDGFTFTYTFVPENNVCGGHYYTNAGTIKSPNYPSRYPYDKLCVWVITVKSGQQINLNIIDFDLELYLNNCNADYLEIRNGGTVASPLIGKYCGQEIPKLFPSHTNQLYLRFKSDSSQNGKGFKITWDSITTGCGGTLTAPTGSIISPNYPEPYSRNTECYWKILVNAGSLIQMVFADLELENHDKCLLDYVEIFDGQNMNSKSLGRFCGSKHPPFIMSSSNKAFVKLRSDVSFQERGFHLSYSTMCNTTLKGFKGIIESPNFPNNYPRNEHCIWHIQVARNNKINITFTHFDLERNPGSSTANDKESCIYDYIEIKYLEKSYTENYVQYGIFCTNKPEGIITLNSDHAEIHFITDSFLHGRGFRLEWQLEGCGGLLLEKEGKFSSPNFPHPYPESIECKWLIEVELGSSIEIHFDVLSLSSGEQCKYDSLKIYNGRNENYTMLANICHQTKPTIMTSTGNLMFIQYEISLENTGTGFNASYKTLKSKCGGKYTASSGTIHSPNYPNNYDKNDICGWLIDIDENYVIELDFEDVDLVKPCVSNNITIFDGPTSAYPVLAVVCTSNKPNNTIKSTYNHMFIELTTSGYFTAKGFSAKYRRGCGARIMTSGNGYIENKQYSEHSDYIDRNCSWTITSNDLTDHVSLTITSMQIFNNFQQLSCTENNDAFVYVFNGENANAPLIGQYCNTKLPPTLTSDGSVMHIVVDISVKFFATYSVYDSNCGGTFNSVDGYFSSPGYPKKYPIDTECEWLIQVGPGNQLNLNFITFEMLESENCNTDYLELRQKSSSGKLIGVYCGNDIPVNVSVTDSLWILFRTSQVIGEVTWKGFYAEYIISTFTNLFGPTGQIASPVYPLEYTYKDNYAWKITVEFGKKILLTFKDFNIISIDRFYGSGPHLQIYDGTDEQGNELETLGGYNLPASIKSTSNVVFIKLQSAILSKNSAKFLLEWIQIEGIPEITGKPKGTACGSSKPINLNGNNSYTLTSPGYPNGYERNLNCEWIFTTTPSNHLAVFFDKVNLDLGIGYNTKCLLDHVEIYERENMDKDWVLKATVCKADQNLIQLTNIVKIAFITNAFRNGSGFSLRIKEQCGGYLTSPSALVLLNNNSIHSIYDRTCEWNITVKPGKTIELKLTIFNLNNNADSCNNYIMLRNGLNSQSPILGNGKYCGEVSKISKYMLETTGNNLYIKYYGSNQIEGFKFEYNEKSFACGKEINLNYFENSTEISSPNYQNIPPPHIECSWIIIAPPGESLRIDFIERFDITTTEGCKFEFVELRDGGSQYSPLIGRYCYNIPSTQYSTDNTMFVKFFTDVNDPKNGFKAKISLEKCGGTIRNISGVVKSPLYNIKQSTITKSTNCTWYLIGPDTHNLLISFDKLELPNSFQNCTDVDNVVISENNPFNKSENIILGQYCGRKLPSDIQSSSNKVKITFEIKKPNLLPGFQLTFNSREEKCGGRMNAAFGIIESPHYPGMNYARRQCTWHIQVPQGRRVKFEFLDFDFDFVNHSVLGFYNDEYFRSRIIYLTGTNTKNTTIRSTDNIMSVYLITSHRSNHRGFKARFTSNEQTDCIGDFNQNSGVIIQPLTIDRYYCTWKRNDQSDNFINQTLVLTIETQVKWVNARNPSKICWYTGASVTIYADTKNVKLAEICTTSTQPIIVRSPYPINKIIAYQAQYTLINYTISYTTHQCGGIINGEEGFIASPNFPQKSSRSIECSWLLILPKEQSIKIKFASINLGDNCDKSYLILYNGITPMSPTIYQHCQRNQPEHIQTQTNYLLIDYHADKDSTGTGFNLTYEPIIKGCGGIFHSKSRYIQTPNYPDDYPNNAECLWEIRTNEGYHIGFHFIGRFHLEQSDNCQNDFIEVWDWRDNNWLSLGRRCGRDAISVFNSTSSRMKVLFRSNDKLTGKGFKAFWETNCGGQFTADTTERYIVSPGYPGKYENNLFCVYDITSPGKIINIAFTEFNLEKTFPECLYDNVTISDKRSIMLGRYSIHHVYCGNEKPPEIRRHGGVKITFRTDGLLTRQGFKFSYKEESCTEVIDSPTSITSPKLNFRSTTVGFMSRYNPPVTCTWTIIAPPNKLVVIEIEYLDLPHTPHCIFNNVQIFDGNNTRLTQRLALLCGNLRDRPSSLVSPNNSVVITFQYHVPSMLYTGKFKANIFFTAGPSEGCGGNIDLINEKTIVAPKNLNNLDCNWVLTAPLGYYIEIKLTEVNFKLNCSNSIAINQTDPCKCNSIEIKDGNHPFSESIIKLCGITNTSDLNQKYFSSTEKAFISFHSSDETNYDAFKLTAKPLQSPCGPVLRNVTNDIQTLTTPNYPGVYPDNIKCTWILKSEQKNNNIFYRAVIQLRFKEFDLSEEHNNQQLTENKCMQDKLTIIDDPNTRLITDGLGPTAVITKAQHYVFTQNNLISGYQFCGKCEFCYDYHSQSETIALKFSSGSLRNRGRGFKLEYQLIGCSRNYTSEQGRIVNKVTDYCSILVTVPETYTISLYFQKFFFMRSNCTTAGLAIYDGPNNSSNKIMEACGYGLPDPVFSTTNKLWIQAWIMQPSAKVFANTISGTYDAVYTSSNKGRGCGGTLFNYKGRISSPLYPNPYRQNSLCTWNIRVPIGMKAAMKFSVFNIHGSCKDNYVKVITYNKDVSDEKIFCPNDNPAVIESDSRITIIYQSSIHNNGGGWLIFFQAVNRDQSYQLVN